MKKILSLILACLLVASLAAFVYADDEEGDKKVAEFIYGTAEIDGQIDDIYQFAPKYLVNELSAGGPATDSYCYFSGLWDDNSVMYFLVEVYDTTPFYSKETYKCDGAEFSFDPYVNEEMEYADDPTAGKLNIGADIDAPIGYRQGEWQEEWVDVAFSYTDTGYIIELRVDFNAYNGIKFKEGMDFGFDLLLNDYPEDGSARTCGLGWNDLTDSSWQYPFVLGLIKLVKVDTSAAAAEAAPEEVEEVAEAAEEAVEEVTYSYPASGESGDIITGDLIGNETGWGENADAGRAAAFDGNPATFFDPLGVGDGFCGIDAGESYILDKVAILSRGDQLGRYDGAKIQGSNDGEEWVTLFTAEGEGSTEYAVITEFENNTGYSQFRYYNDKNHGDVAEVEFYGHAGAAEETVDAAEEAPEVEDIAVDTALEEKMEDKAAQTFDFGVIAAVAAVVSLAGFAVSKKR